MLINALVLRGLANFRVFGHSETGPEPGIGRKPGVKGKSES
jgi:hypothetical protein